MHITGIWLFIWLLVNFCLRNACTPFPSLNLFSQYKKHLIGISYSLQLSFSLPCFLIPLALPKFRNQWGLTVMHMNSSMPHNQATNPHCGSGDSLSYTSNKGKLPVNTITVSFFSKQTQLLNCVCGMQPCVLAVSGACCNLRSVNVITIMSDPATPVKPPLTANTAATPDKQSVIHAQPHTCVCMRCPLMFLHLTSPWKPIFSRKQSAFVCVCVHLCGRSKQPAVADNRKVELCLREARVAERLHKYQPWVQNKKEKTTRITNKNINILLFSAILKPDVKLQNLKQIHHVKNAN